MFTNRPVCSGPGVNKRSEEEEDENEEEEEKERCVTSLSQQLLTNNTDTLLQESRLYSNIRVPGIL